MSDNHYVQPYAIPAQPLSEESQEKLRQRQEMIKRNTHLGAHAEPYDEKKLAERITTIKVCE